MFKVGDYVSYGCIGVCKVEGITKMAMDRKEKPKEYYILRPVYEQRRTIYSPVDSTKIMIRRNISEEEVNQLLDLIPEMEMFSFDNKKVLEAQCKEAVMSGDCKEWVRLIKSLLNDRRVRVSQGRKITSTSEKYLHDVESRLYGELSVTLNQDISQIEKLMHERFEKAVI